MPGADAYATSKQVILAATLTFARETHRLHCNAVEPGVNPISLGSANESGFGAIARRLHTDGGANALFKALVEP